MAERDRRSVTILAPRSLANAVLFNVSWLAILVTQSAGVAVAIVGLHLLLHYTVVGMAKREWLLITAVTVIGALIDQGLFLSGVLTVGGLSAPAPVWLTCLWPVFATTLMHAFAGLQRHCVLAAVVGAVGGALSYLAGSRLANVDFASALWGPVVIALLWALLFPLLLQLAARLMRGADALQSWEPAARRAFD